MLSEKEAMELGERIMGHICLVEKYRVYAQQAPDPQIKDILNRHQQMFQNHYQTMVGFLQNAQNFPGGVMPQTQWRYS
ncbi:MAG: spore coat protein [Bacillota bacterium]|nr:spore coat protein [Thermoanaerobacteraceae bacterium]